MTMLASFGGGCTSIAYSLIRLKGKTEVIDIINGILGSLVAVTAGCFLYEGTDVDNDFYFIYCSFSFLLRMGGLNCRCFWSFNSLHVYAII